VKVTQVENGEFLRNLAQLIQPHTADIEDEFTDFLLSPQAVKGAALSSLAPSFWRSQNLRICLVLFKGTASAVP